MEETTLRQKYTNRFLRASEVGLLGFAYASLMSAVLDPLSVSVLTRLSVIVAAAAWGGSLIVMFLYRRTDEYTLSLWHAGTGASFIMTTLLLVFGSFFEQLFYSIFMPDRLLDRDAEFAFYFGAPMLMFAFYLGVLGKRVLTR